MQYCYACTSIELSTYACRHKPGGSAYPEPVAHQPKRNPVMGAAHPQPASIKGSTSKLPSPNIVQPRETRGQGNTSQSYAATQRRGSSNESSPVNTQPPRGAAVSAGLHQSSGAGTQQRSDHLFADFDHAALSRKTVSSQSSSSSVNSIPMGGQTANSIRPPPAGFQFEADFQSTSKHTTNEILTQMTMLQSLCETYVV